VALALWWLHLRRPLARQYPFTTTATLTVTDSLSGIVKTAALNGTVTGPAVPPVTLTPGSLTFAGTEVGTVSTAQAVTVSAPYGDPVRFEVFGTNANAAEDFSVSPRTCVTQTPCQVSITFQPSAMGSRMGGFYVADAITGASATLTLQGTGGVATVSLSVASLIFAARAVGSTSIPQVVTLTNTGDTNLAISAIVFAGTDPADFSMQANTCGSTVVAGANCAISISFDPAASGPRSATLQIVSSALNSPVAVDLSGIAN
jgi:trimeric autotransporter adhesin